MTVDALPQQVELAFTALEQPLPAIQFLEALADGIAQALDLVAERRRLKVGADGFALRSPAVHIPPDRGAVSLSLSRAADLAKVDFLFETRADEPAGVPHQRPAHRRRALAVVVDMLLRLVRVVPAHLLLESPGLVVVLDAPNVGANDAFQGVEHRAGTEAVHRAAPIRACPQIDGVVVSVCEPEPKQDAPRGLQPERVDELLAHEAHRGRAQDDDALLVQSNDALIGPKIEQFGEVQIVAARRVVAT